MEKMLNSRGLIFIDTHFAPYHEKDLATCVFKDTLSELTEIEHQGKVYQGRWYLEYHEENEDRWTSVSNQRSFWLTEKDLICALTRAGFTHIYKPYGVFELEQEFNLREHYSRAYYIGLKSDYFTI
jgi:hypothetical protein